VIKGLKLKNFLTHVDTEVKFGKGAIAILGNNGQGKSSLLEAILYALYGEGRDSVSELAFKNAEEMEVELDIGLGKKSYEIKRGRKNGKGYIALDGEKPEKDTIEKIVGWNVESFETVLFFSSNLFHFFQITPANRLELLQKLFGLDIYDKFLKRTITHKKEITVLMERLAEETKKKIVLRDELQEMIKAGSVVEKQIKYKEEEVKIVEDNLQGIEKEREKVKGTKVKYGKAQEAESQKIDDCKGKVERLVIVKAKILKLSRELERKEEKVEGNKKELQEDLDRIGSDIKLYNLKKKSVKQGFCELCRGHLIEELLCIWDNLDKSKMEDEEARILDKLRKIEAVEKKGVIEKTKSQTEKEQFEKEVKVLEKEIENLKVEIKEKKKESLELYEKYKKEEGLDKKKSDLEKMKIQVETELKALKGKKKEITGLKDKVKLYVSEIKEIEEKYKSERKKWERFEVLEEAFSRYGIRLYVLEQLIKELEVKGSMYLQELVGGVNYRIEIEVEKGEDAGVEFYFVEDNFRKKFKRLSAGEKVLFTLAIRLGLADILREYTNTELDFLVLDEVAGNLDEIRRGFLVDVVDRVLKEYFKQVFVISHVGLNGDFDQEFLVEKKKGVSVVRRV
jgi:exonuclease SbcC